MLSGVKSLNQMETLIFALKKNKGRFVRILNRAHKESISTSCTGKPAVCHAN